MDLTNFYYFIGGVVGTASFLSILLAGFNHIYYSKISGELLENKFNHHSEIIEYLLKKSDKETKTK